MTQNQFEYIQVVEKNGVVQILLDRPSIRHAINQALVTELHQALDNIEAGTDIRVVILSSTDNYFCSGADLVEGTGQYANSEEQILNMYWPLLQRLANLPQILIAAVPGTTAGIGCALVFNADLVVMHEKAKLFFAFSKIGLIADGGVHWFLRQHLGYQKAFELLVEGGSIDAQYCHDQGIANRIVRGSNSSLDAAQTWAQQLAQCAPIAVAHSKRCLQQAPTLSLEETIKAEAAAQKICEQSQDAHEGIQAFLEKRPAHFKGR